MYKSIDTFMNIICILTVAIAVVVILVRINPFVKITINKKWVLIGFIPVSIMLLLFLNWRYSEFPSACYSEGRWGPESPEIAKNLSSDDRMIMLEYIRDHIRGTRHAGNDRAPQPNDTIYIGYGDKAWQSGSDKAWQSGSESEVMTEINPIRISFLMDSLNDTYIGPNEHIYNIHFQSIKAGIVCVGVLHLYSPFYPTRSHGFYHYIWVFEKSFSGKWELFTILPDGIV